MYRYYATYPEKGIQMHDFTFISSFIYLLCVTISKLYSILIVMHTSCYTYLAHILHVVIYILLYILKSEGNIFPKLFVSAYKFSNIDYYNL